MRNFKLLLILGYIGLLKPMNFAERTTFLQNIRERRVEDKELSVEYIKEIASRFSIPDLEAGRDISSPVIYERNRLLLLYLGGEEHSQRCAPSLEVVRALLQARAGLDVPSIFGTSPLICAVEKDLKPIAEELIRSGADWNFVGDCGKTAISCAKNRGSESTLQRLIKERKAILKRIDNDCKDRDIKEDWLSVDGLPIIMEDEVRQVAPPEGLPVIVERSDASEDWFLV